MQTRAMRSLENVEAQATVGWLARRNSYCRTRCQFKNKTVLMDTLLHLVCDQTNRLLDYIVGP